MRKIWLCALAAALVLGLTACGRPEPETVPVTTVPETTEATVPVTVPADGNPNDVTCKGSYTGEGEDAAEVARVGDAVLTNEVLRAYYWAEAAAYRQSGESPAPDFEKPLDTQVCEVDQGVGSWQQFFLRRALNTWHSAQALRLQGLEEGLPREEAYQPDPVKYERYMSEMPANKVLYRYEKSFSPNSMHQAWLDAVPEMLDTLAEEKGCGDAGDMAQTAFGTSREALETFVRDYNWGYMYFTNLSYFIEPTEEEIDAAQAALTDAEEGVCADLRHILLIPGAEGDAVTVAEDGTVTCSEDLWTACEDEARALLETWALPKNKPTEATFADMAFRHSEDAGSQPDGGAYRGVRQGQLTQELDDWCFSQDRAAGDTTIFRSAYGVHILYFSGRESLARKQAEEAVVASHQADLLTLARRKYPMEVTYSAIVLTEGKAEVSLSDVLYPDVAHERFPEIPLYLQQDYPKTLYGMYEIRTNGCGITTMAMLASYMTDDELTPPELCARYGNYSYVHGTDGMLYINEPPAMGFYVREKTYEPTKAKAALQEGQVVISLQQKGYWTRGGHYIALEKIFEDDTVQVRDSNIFNYSNIRWHKVDRHEWRNIIGAASGFWIVEDKLTHIPACARCGGGDHTRDFLRQDYLCHKCSPALLRRKSYLNGCGL